MDFRILGPLEVWEDGRLVSVGGAKQRALLTILILQANQVVSAERLLDDLWGENQPASGVKALHVFVSQLRKAIGDDRLVTRAPGYTLLVDDDELDAKRAERLCKHAEEAEPREAAAMLRDALSLWRGSPLADLEYESFAQSEIARLEELHVGAIEQRVDADLAVGRHSQLIGELEALVKAHPLRERLRRQQMLALYRSGRQAEALAAYREARRALVDDLGIEPTRALRELEEAILRQDPSLDGSDVRRDTRDATTTVFVGREREMAVLHAALADAMNGEGRLVLLSGEPGIGKSRLIDELVVGAKARDVRVVAGRCWEAGGAPAYWPWVQLLRAYLRDVDRAALRPQLGTHARDGETLPELQDLLPELGPAAWEDSDGARFRLFEAVSAVLRRRSGGSPLLVILDDLHAADEPSLVLLQFIAREIRDSALLIVAAYRDVDPTPRDPLVAALTDIAREPGTVQLSLGGLDEASVARFIALSSGQTPHERVVAAIHSETEGNPLFVGELIRLATTEGVLGEDVSGLTIPQTIRDVIARRLRHLSEQCNGVLILASVLGPEFDVAALARLAGLSEDDLLDVLDEALAERIVSNVPLSADRLRFAHVLMRDTLYERLSTPRRVRLHRQLVAALEELYGADPSQRTAELAHHSIAGSDFERGLQYAQQAGRRALRLLAYEEAARLYEMALDALLLASPEDEDARCDLLLSLGEAHARSGDTPAAKRAFLEAAAIARDHGFSRQLARAAFGYGGRKVWARPGTDDRVVPLLEEGLAEVGSTDPLLRVKLLARLAGALRDEHSRERRDALSREAVDLARGIGDRAALAYALDGRTAAMIAPDTVRECLAVSTELCAIARDLGDKERLVEGLDARLVAHAILGDMEAVMTDLAAAQKLAEEIRQPTQLWDVCGDEAMLALATGRLDDAEELIPRAYQLGVLAQPELAVPIYHVHRYMLAELRGPVDQNEGDIVRLVVDYPTRPVFRCLLAHLYARIGRHDAASELLAELGRDGAAALPFDQEWLFGMSFLAETSTLVAASSHPTLYETLVPWADLNAADLAEGMRGSVSRYLGLLAASMEQWEDAARHFENALAMNARMQARPWLARTQEDYGRMLLTRAGADRDAERAAELIDDAARTYREIGMSAVGAPAAQ